MRLQASILILIHYSTTVLQPLCDEISSICQSNGIDYELIVINNGIEDKNVVKTGQLEKATIVDVKKDTPLMRAFCEGAKVANFPFLVKIDAHGQSELNDIPKLLQAMLIKNADMMTTARKNRTTDWLDRLQATFLPTDFNDNSAPMCVFKSHLLATNDFSSIHYRLVPFFLQSNGFNVKQLQTTERPILYPPRLNKVSSLRIIQQIFSLSILQKSDSVFLKICNQYAKRFILLGFILLIAFSFSFYGQSVHRFVSLGLGLSAFCAFVFGLQLWVVSILAESLQKNQLISQIQHSTVAKKSIVSIPSTSSEVWLNQLP